MKYGGCYRGPGARRLQAKAEEFVTFESGGCTLDYHVGFQPAVIIIYHPTVKRLPMLSFKEHNDRPTWDTKAMEEARP